MVYIYAWLYASPGAIAATASQMELTSPEKRFSRLEAPLYGVQVPL